MSKRDVIRDVLDHIKPDYVPWSFGFTKEAKDKLHDHYDALMDRYRGRLSFYGGLSTQKTLPYGSVEDVRAETAQEQLQP